MEGEREEDEGGGRRTSINRRDKESAKITVIGGDRESEALRK